MRLRQLWGSLYVRILLSFAIALSLVATMISYVLYWQYGRATLASVNEAYAQNLSQVGYSAQYMNESAQNLLWSLFQEPNTSVLMFDNDHNMERLVPELRRLNNLVATYPFVHSIYIYNQKLDRFLSTGTGPVAFGSDFKDAEVGTWIKQSRLPAPSLPYPRQLSGADSTDGEKERVYSYFAYEKNSDNGVSGAVILNIQSDYLQNQIDSFGAKGAVAKDIRTLVIDADGRVVNEGGDFPFLSDAPKEGPIGTILNSPTSQGFQVGELMGTKSIMTYLKNEAIQWTFIQIVPYEQFMEKANRIRLVTIIVCAFMIVLCIVAAVALSGKIYRPIGRLVERAVGVQERGKQAAKKLSDIRILDSALSQAYLNSRNKAATEKQAKLRQLVLDHKLGESRQHAVLENYGMTLGPEETFRMIGIRLDRYRDFVSTYTEQDRSLLRFALGNAASEMFGSRFPRREVIDLENDMLLLWIAVKGQTGQDEEQILLRMARELQSWSMETLRLSFSAAVSSSYMESESLRLAAQEAKQLLRYRLKYGHGCMLSPRILDSLLRGEDYRLSQGDEQQLKDAIINGRDDEAAAICDRLLTELLEYPFETVTSKLLYLSYLIYQTVTLMECNGLDEYPLPLSEHVERIHQAETVDEVKACMFELFRVAAENVRQRKASRSGVLLESIIHLLETRYADPGLNLDAIADELQMSKDHLGKLFRRAYGQSVADYLVELRVRKVVEELRESNSDLQDILNRVGVENKKYFYTLFKKKMGVSLKDYRLKHLRESKNRPAADS